MNPFRTYQFILRKINRNLFTSKNGESTHKDAGKCDANLRDEVLKQKVCNAHKEEDITFDRNEVYNLTYKAAVVIGGEEGIGYACAKELLGANCRVCGILGKNLCEGMEAAHNLNCTYGKGKAVFYEGDVTNGRSIQTSIHKLHKDIGKIDIFVNAFGIYDGKNWQRELDTNLIGMTRANLLEFDYFQRLEKPSGHIVNTAGLFAMVPLAGSPTVSAAQHGVLGLSTSLGNQSLYKKSKTRVLTICPGYTNTKFFRNAKARAANPVIGKILNEQLEGMIKQNPEACGKACVHALRYGESASVWMVDGSKLYKVEIPHPSTYSELLVRYFC